jgi:hypothetical protein
MLPGLLPVLPVLLTIAARLHRCSFTQLLLPCAAAAAALQQVPLLQLLQDILHLCAHVGW